MAEKKGLGSLGGKAIVRRQTGGGPLAALANRGGALTKEDKTREQGLRTRAAEAASRALERFTSGQLQVEIGIDYSASTTGLHESLLAIAKSLGTKIVAKHPLARTLYGVYGGGDLVKNGEGTGVLENGHEGTNSWESTFARYARQYSATPDPQRQDVLISFHDATPKVDGDMDAAIQLMNANDTIVFVIFYPSGGSSSEDKRVLRQLTEPNRGGFKRGIFIDLSEVDVSDPSIVEDIISDIVDAVSASNQEAATKSPGNKHIAASLARTSLAAKMGPILDRAKQASRRKLLTDHTE